MNKPRTIVQQFLSALSDKQRGLVRDYYRMLTDPCIPREVVVNRIDEIWSFAEDDSVLLSWLESIDFILSDEDDEEEKLSNDKRAYLSEHLSKEVNLLGCATHSLSESWDSKLVGCVAEEKSVTAILKCPDGKNHIVVTSSSDQLPCKGKPFSAQLCRECNFMLHEHQVVIVINDPVAI